MKIISKDIIHKTDAGGVKLNLATVERSHECVGWHYEIRARQKSESKNSRYVRPANGKRQGSHRRHEA